MNRLSPIIKSIGALVVAMGVVGATHAEDLSQPVILVASSALDGSPFEQAVVVASPLPDGGHIGFIINRPMNVKLDTLLPQDAAARNVTETVYLGGPALLPALFAVTRNAPEDAGAVVPLMPGLVAVLDAASIDRILEKKPNDARYFVGLMLWSADELEDQVHQNVWEVRAADADTVLRANTSGLWNSLRGTMAHFEPVLVARFG
jgi:putative transcriptional regulator